MAREIPQWEKQFLHKHKDLSSDLQNSWKVGCNFRITIGRWEVEIVVSPGSPGPTTYLAFVDICNSKQ